MNTSSEYSGACDSGWTTYLYQFSSSEDQCNRSMPVDLHSQRNGDFLNQDEDEDSSMLSDASSGPPNFHQDEDCSEETRRYNPSFPASEQRQGKHRKGGTVKEGRSNKQSVQLDDTASSPVQSFSKNNAAPKKDKFSVDHSSGFSQGFSATQLKGKSALTKHFGFLKSSHQKKS